VSLAAPSPYTATVHVATTSGSATAGSDFAPVSVDLRFKPGETQKTVRVRVLRDRITEGTETFTVSLSQPGDAILVRASAVGTILGP
jgi:chitinase